MTAETLAPVRPSWDEYGLALAQTVALRADCTRRRVGAVVLDAAHRVVGAGYNGAPPGHPGCLSDGACPRGRLTTEELTPGTAYDTCTSVHAEVNAVLRAAWADLDGGTLYCTDVPCKDCGKVLRATPLARVVTPEGEWEFDLGAYGG